MHFGVILNVLAADSPDVSSGNWIIDLFKLSSVAHAVLILSLAAAIGLAVGRIKVFGISLGIAGVLFSGLAFAHFGFSIEPQVLEFTREFGLILFVYTIGLQVGPGFLGSLRKAGLPLNLMAGAIVLLGVLVTLGVVYTSGAIGRPISMPTAVGLLSGGTTNTPSLAAAQDAVKEVISAKVKHDTATTSQPTTGQTADATQPKPLAVAEVAKMPALGYAVAYPFGILGIIFTMLLIRTLFRVDVSKENELLAKLNLKGTGLETISLEVSNPNLDGHTIAEIPQLHEGGVVISRLLHAGVTSVALPESVIKLGDVLHAVGTKERLENLKMLVGRESAVDVKRLPSNITTRKLVVTRTRVLGQTIEELDLLGKYGVTITRTSRAEVEIAATPGWRFQFGDVVLAVGEPDAIKQAAAAIGDSLKKLDHPHIIPIFVGIALGVILGMLPFTVPGIPAPVKLGLAGGPLVVAIVLSRIGQIGQLTWYMPRSSNFALRELGIVLFLACVGLKAGDRFVATLVQGDGLYWMAMASLITFLPLVIVGFVARTIFKVNFVTLCGVLAGSMTDPPALQFANQMTNGEAPSIAYATVYPLTMLLRVVSAQVLVLLFWRP